MPHLKSPYSPVPPIPDLNHFTLAFEIEPGKSHPRDHVVQVDLESGEQRTHGEFIERIRDCATALTASRLQGGLEIRPGGERQDVIIIFSPNCLDYFALVHAALLVTVPFCSLPSKPTLAELTYLLSKIKTGSADVRLRLFVHPTLLSLALSAGQQVGLQSEDICILDGRVHDAGLPDLNSLIANVRRKGLPRQPVVPARKNTLAYLMFSSGTSGPPKAVMVSHGNLCFSLLQGITRALDDKSFQPPSRAPTQRWLCFLPLYHSLALHYLVMKTTLIVKTMYILPRWNIDRVLEGIPKYKIDSLILVPSIVHQFVHSAAARHTDLTSIRAVGCGAAYLSPELEKQLTQLFEGGKKSTGGQPEVLEGYGLSEATISCISRPLPGHFGVSYNRASMGLLLPGQEARIVREDGSEADFDESGELWLKGDNITLGYWGDEAATRETFLPGGWLRTGDRFYASKDGSLFYEDRTKDTLKISGAQVAPAEIERVLLSHPHGLLVDAAVAGVPSALSGDPALARDERIPRAWVVPSEAGKAMGPRQMAAELDKWVRGQLSRYKWLTGGIDIVTEIPKSPTGKVLRRVLVAQYIEEHQQSKAKAKL